MNNKQAFSINRSIKNIILFLSLLFCGIIWLPQSTFGVIEEYLILLGLLYIVIKSTIDKEILFSTKSLILTFSLVILFAYCYWVKWRGDYLYGQIANWFNISLSQSVLTIIIGSLCCVISGYAIYLTSCSCNCPVSVSDRKIKLQLNDYLIAFILAFFCSMQFALNPIFPLSPGGDSSVFLLLGDRLHKGFTLYKDIFDHKGPFLFFLEWLGLFIPSPTYSGVWIIELINMFAVAVIVMKTAALFSSSRKVWVFTCIVTIFLGGMQAYDEGNYSEEYALPWIALSLYIFLKYFISKNYKKRDIILLGISFSLILLLRANMIGVWATFIPAVLISLIIQSRWKDIFISIGMFVLGNAIILVPLSLVAARGGWLNYMWEYYVEFNFAYTESELTMASFITSALYLATRLSFTLIPFFGTLMYSKNKLLWLNALGFVVSLVMASLAGRNYSHYAMVLILFMTVPCCVWLETNKISFRISSFVRDKLSIIVTIAIILLILISIIFFTKQFETPEVARYIAENTKPEDNVLILGINAFDYLKSDRDAGIRFYIQNFISEKAYEDFLNQFYKHDVDYVVVKQSVEEALTGSGYNSDFCRRLYEEYQINKDKGYRLDDQGTFHIYCRKGVD